MQLNKAVQLYIYIHYIFVESNFIANWNIQSSDYKTIYILLYCSVQYSFYVAVLFMLHAHVTMPTKVARICLASRLSISLSNDLQFSDILLWYYRIFLSTFILNNAPFGDNCVSNSGYAKHPADPLYQSGWYLRYCLISKWKIYILNT